MADYNNYDRGPSGTPMYDPPQYQPQPGMAPPPGYPQKSRMAAGILAILLGTYGVHSFYLGNTSRGLLQLLLTLLTCGIGALIMFIWGVDTNCVLPHPSLILLIDWGQVLKLNLSTIKRQVLLLL